MKIRQWLLSGITLLSMFGAADLRADWLNRGYVKYGFSHAKFPDQSLIQITQGHDQLAYQALSARLMSEYTRDNVTVAGHYDLQYLYSHQKYFTPGMGSDSGNYFDLSDLLIDQDSQRLLQRVDRLYVHYKGTHLSTKIGRQALTWGHGMFFQVMDIVSPFSPVALDTDYKPGTDMAYGEWVTNRGDDAQAVFIPRKNNTDLSLRKSLYAVKLHGFVFNSDVDLMLASDDESEILGFGIARPIKESMWRLDVVEKNENAGKERLSVVTNIDYSWVLAKHNFYGFIEYLYDSIGGRNQGGMLLQDNHYLAMSMRIELHPLLNVTPSIINNLKDDSGLFYINIEYDWMQNMNTVASFIIPFGDEDSDFSGTYTPGQEFRILMSAYF